jgi:hypothetical protein
MAVAGLPAEIIEGLTKSGRPKAAVPFVGQMADGLPIRALPASADQRREQRT